MDLSENGKGSAQKLLGIGNPFFPKAEWTRGVPGTILDGEYAQTGWGKWAEMDILGAVKTCEFSGKVILHLGLPPGGPETLGAFGTSRKIFWTPGGENEVVNGDMGISRAEMEFIPPPRGTLEVQMSKSVKLSAVASKRCSKPRGMDNKSMEFEWWKGRAKL